jgi:cytidylate kinase
VKDQGSQIEDPQSEMELLGKSPRHGFQGNRGPAPLPPALPASLTVAISREAGSRGETIAHRAGRKLGWQVYNQELLEYVAQEGPFRQGITDSLTPAIARWAEERLEVLLREQNVSQHPSILELARIILSLGAQGDVIVIGRGAGCILPRESTLNVRIIAPLADRIAYMSQWLRLTVDEAAAEVEKRDRRRAEFIGTHFHRQPGDIYQYDLLLNTSLLGEDLCVQLLVEAARAKQEARQQSRGVIHGSPPPATDS